MAKRYSLPEKNSRLVGQIQWHQVTKGDYFELIAKQYNVGMIALIQANPGIDPFLPDLGQTLIIPTQMLLPDIDREGIVINLPELRLYYYPKGRKEVHVFPVGIGRFGYETPLMVTKIKARIPNPSWTPTTRHRQEYYKRHGEPMPALIPAGPNNPLGKYALQLEHNNGHYLIHGTNNNFGIGMRVSSGCIRLRPQDIEWLYKHTRIGNSVVVLERNIKISIEPDGKKLIEVHSPLSKIAGQILINRTSTDILGKSIELNKEEKNKIKRARELHSGIPVDISAIKH
jgi:L,D-transpeptidase YbiS